MKNLFLVLTILSVFTSFGQIEEKPIKPKYVIICNNQIITEDKLTEYAKNGLIKSMSKGVSQKERDDLYKKFGNAIGNKEFIMIIELNDEKDIVKKKSQIGTGNETDVIGNQDELKLKIKDSATDFIVEMIDGTKIKLSDLKGKVVLLNFWATWCAPCIMEFAELPEKILNPFENEDFVFIPISIGELKEKVLARQDSMKKYGINFNLGIDPSKEIWDSYATGSIPKNFVIDKEGIIRYVSVGNPEGSLDKIKNKIEVLLKE